MFSYFTLNNTNFGSILQRQLLMCFCFTWKKICLSLYVTNRQLSIVLRRITIQNISRLQSSDGLPELSVQDWPTIYFTLKQHHCMVRHMFHTIPLKRKKLCYCQLDPNRYQNQSWLVKSDFTKHMNTMWWFLLKMFIEFIWHMSTINTVVISRNS